MFQPLFAAYVVVLQTMRGHPMWQSMDQPGKTKISGANGDRGISIFPFQLTTSRIGNLTRLIYTLLYVMTIRLIHVYS